MLVECGLLMRQCLPRKVGAHLWIQSSSFPFYQEGARPKDKIETLEFRCERVMNFKYGIQNLALDQSITLTVILE